MTQHKIRAICIDCGDTLVDEATEVKDGAVSLRADLIPGAKELIHELKGRYAIVIVTHNMQQAARVSQCTAFFHLGALIEYGPTSDIFTNPREARTRDYITGRYG